MTDEIITDGKKIKCPCYIDRPLYRYDKGCLIQSQAFTEQQTKEKPILRCDEIQNCPIKNLYKQLKRKEEECEKLNKIVDKIKHFVRNRMFDVDCENWFERFEYCFEEWQKEILNELQAEQQKVKELEEECKILEDNFETSNRDNLEIIDNYKQALEEIRGMLEVNIEQINLYPLKTNLEKILQKCEVLND